jgi:predicted ATPase
MSTDLETLLKHLREGTGRVELDLPSPVTLESIEISAQLALERRNAISRGERLAHLYVAPSFAPTPSIKVTDGEARALMEAGARWVGPDSHAPRPLVTRPSRMLEAFRLRNFKAHRDTELRFSRLTALVGDNASGKTSVLEALALQGSLRSPIGNMLRGGSSIANLLRRGTTSNRVTLASTGSRGDDSWSTTLHLEQAEGEKYRVEISARVGAEEYYANATGDRNGWVEHANWDGIRGATGSAGLYRFRGEQIAAAAYSHDPDVRVAADGTNTAVVLANMKLSDDERFEVIVEAMRRLVPSLLRIRLGTEKIESRKGKSARRASKIHFDFHGASDVPADCASQGTLILLALLTTIYGPARPDLILIDDLEQALHPRAQRELVQLLLGLILREEFSDLQIVATTHSPYVLDLLDPSTVHALALRDDGTVASKRLSEHPDAETARGSITAGQLWSLDEERRWVLT